ncbi:MAG: Wadjet anti-phage system protein JetD domain-containing protein [Candidatus Rifleibacteriota bacterium]
MKSEWSELKTVKEKLNRQWLKGRFYKAILAREEIFPFFIKITAPSSKQLNNSFNEARAWLNSFQQQLKTHLKKCGIDNDEVSIKWQQINHKVFGKNSLPGQLEFTSIEAVAAFLNRKAELKTFYRIIENVQAQLPELNQWLMAKPLEAVKNDANWPPFIIIIKWLKENPRPGIYIRQLDLAGIDTKFIECNRKILAELLDLTLDPENVDFEARGVSNFARRYGFKDKPSQIRFRFLDSALFINGLSDLQVPIDDFILLNPEIENIFITENEINGLAFPPVKRALVLFGLGYGLERIKNIEWFKNKRIYYWGDLDTHGFVMLDQLRHYYPHARSMLMDKKTLLAHRHLWGCESKPSKRELSHLNSDELSLYKDIQQHKYKNNLRLEQERISFSLIKQFIENLEDSK